MQGELWLVTNSWRHEIFSRLGLEGGSSRRVKLETRAEKTRCSRRLGLAPPCFVNLCTDSPRNVCVCNRLLFYSNCTGFTICFTYNDISLSMYRNQCWINVELLYLLCIVVVLSQKRFFERFWRSLSSPFTVSNNRRTREDSLFLKASSAGAIFPQKIAWLRFQTSQQKGRKNHASPRTFRSKIHLNGPELALEEN